VYHHMFSLVTGVCVEYPSYVLSIYIPNTHLEYKHTDTPNSKCARVTLVIQFKYTDTPNSKCARVTLVIQFK
jgi:hypothetical protein